MLQRSAFQTVGEDVRDSADIWDCRTGRKGPTNNTLDNYTYGMQKRTGDFNPLTRVGVSRRWLVYIATSVLPLCGMVAESLGQCVLTGGFERRNAFGIVPPYVMQNLKYNFATGTVTNENGHHYKNGERVE